MFEIFSPCVFKLPLFSKRKCARTYPAPHREAECATIAGKAARLYAIIKLIGYCILIGTRVGHILHKIVHIFISKHCWTYSSFLKVLPHYG